MARKKPCKKPAVAVEASDGDGSTTAAVPGTSEAQGLPSTVSTDPPVKPGRQRKKAIADPSKPKKPRKPKVTLPKTNRKITGDGGGGPNAEGATVKKPKAPPKPKKPLLLDEFGNVIKRGRGRPKGSKGTKYTRRKPLQSATLDGASTIGTLGTGFNSLKSSLSSRRGGRGARGGRGRGGRRGRGRGGGGVGSVQAAKHRNKVLRELMEEEEKNEEENFVEPDVPEVDFDTEDILMKMYDSEGRLISNAFGEAPIPALSARCPTSAPYSNKRPLDIGRRGRKRRLAVEKEEVVPVQALFQKITRLSKGLGRQDHALKMILKTRKSIVEHRNAAEKFNLKINVKEETVDNSGFEFLSSTESKSQILAAIGDLRRDIFAYILKWTRFFTTQTNWKNIERLVCDMFQRTFLAFKTVYPTFSERWAEVKEFTDEILSNIYEDITEMLVKCADLKFTVIELLEQITIAEAEKNLQIDILEIYNSSEEVRKAQHMDESCIWGLKPLRIAFTPPYFKQDDGLVAASAAFNMSSFDRSSLFPLGNQKWTPRDMTQLRLSIREVVVERRTREIDLKYEELMKECYEVRERVQYLQRLKLSKLNGNGDEKDLPPAPKKRGRPKKDPIYAHINPHLIDLKIDATIAKEQGYDPNAKYVVRYNINNLTVRDWRNKCLDTLNKLKFEQIAINPELMKLVDWEAVSTKLMLVTKKTRSMHDCRLAFDHNANPNLKRRWTAADSAHLVEILAQEKVTGELLSWEQVAENFNGSKTEFTCYFRWRSQKDTDKRIKWNDEKDEKLLSLAIAYRGNWKKTAAELGDAKATKNNVIERFKKKVNPILRNGAFDKVEDSLLLLALEKLKGHMNREGHFGELTAYLPWRFESTWRDRAGNVFADWVVPWTLEEDRKLMGLVHSMKRSWKHIATMFSSFKNRKGCLTRYKILEKGLKKYGSLEAYHETYAMTRYNTFQCEHLNRVLELLKKVVRQPLIPFPGLSPHRPPTNDELQSLILSYNKTIVSSTIQSIEKYLERRNAQWVEWIDLYGKRQRTFDRRTFHPENPQSVASALHIRGILLKPKSVCPPNLTSFQSQVYLHYARFTRTKPLKKDAKRRYLPTGTELLKLEEVKDIIYGFDPDRCPTPPPDTDEGERERGGRWKRKLEPSGRKEPTAKKKLRMSRKSRSASQPSRRGGGTRAGRGRGRSSGTPRGGGTAKGRGTPGRHSPGSRPIPGRSSAKRRVEETTTDSDTEAEEVASDTNTDTESE